jgi:hypothetical protein
MVSRSQTAFTRATSAPRMGRRIDRHQDHDGHRNAPGLRAPFAAPAIQEAARLLILTTAAAVCGGPTKHEPERVERREWAIKPD